MSWIRTSTIATTVTINPYSLDSLEQTKKYIKYFNHYDQEIKIMGNNINIINEK